MLIGIRSCFGAFVFAVGMLLPALAAAQQKLTPLASDGWAPFFGSAVGGYDGRLAVAARWGGKGGFVDFFERDAAGVWQRAERVESPIRDADSYGHAIAMGGGWLAVAGRDLLRPWDNFVDLFQQTDGVWRFAQRVAVPPQTNQTYVRAMAVSARTLALSMDHYDPDANIVRTHTVTFHYAGGSWGYPLEPPRPAGVDLIGLALVLDGESLFVTAPNVVLSYVFSGGSWSLASTLNGPGGNQYGRALAHCGERLYVGRPYSGIVYVYRGNAQGWVEDGPPITTPSGRAGTPFGNALACEGDKLVVLESTIFAAHVVDMAAGRRVITYTIADPAARTLDQHIGLAGGTFVVSQSNQTPLGAPPGTNIGAAYVFDPDTDLVFADGFD